jgi:uncharacterized protein
MALIIDGHVHCVGDGSAGSGCWIDLHSPWRNFTGRMLVRSTGLPTSLLRGGLDEAYRDQLLRWVRGSSLDRVVLLAQDEAYRDDGTKIEGHATFYVPNDYVLRLSREHEEFLPAVSIHPSRRDARAELDRCLAAGARIMKLLPNVHHVECSAPRHRDFWMAAAAGGMILLAHTGGEATLPVLAKHLESPEMLRGPLECGVTCIAAHGAGRNTPLAAHHTPTLLRLMREYPHLYADNSALTTLNRHDTLPELLGSGLVDRVLHGSDYPVPVIPWGPWISGLYDVETVWMLKRIENPLERDYQAKRLMGFGEESFTRLGALLGLA